MQKKSNSEYETKIYEMLQTKKCGPNFNKQVNTSKVPFLLDVFGYCNTTIIYLDLFTILIGVIKKNFSQTSSFLIFNYLFIPSKYCEIFGAYSLPNAFTTNHNCSNMSHEKTTSTPNNTD